MIRRRQAPASPRVVFVGRRCDLSAIPLQGLIQGNVNVAACLIPARRLPGQTREPVRLVPPSRLRRLPLLAVAPTTSIDQITSERQIPLYEISDACSEQLASLVEQLKPDLLAVSCFPWRIADTILETARSGAINVHPSLLPRHRGPDPLFWTFQQGETETGVSIHLMTADLDAGPIIEHLSLPLPAPIDGAKVEQRLAGMAASALPEIARNLAAGDVKLVAQDESRASYEGWPEDGDLSLSPDWTVARVLRFVTGVVSLGYHPLIEFDGEMQEVEAAVAGSEPVDGRSYDTTLVRVDFADGSVRLRLAKADEEPV